MRAGRSISFCLTLLFLRVAGAFPGDAEGILIENFETGVVQLSSYPGEDQQPSGWSIDSLLTPPGSTYALRLSGNTWKVEAISPVMLDSGDTWRISAYVAQAGEVQGFGIMDSAHTLFFAFAGSEEVDPALWVTVDQGAFPLSTWIDFRLPVADEWLTRYGYLPAVTAIVFVNDRDTDPTSVILFDNIEDITGDLPTAPRVSISHTAGALYHDPDGRLSVDIQFTSQVTDPDGPPYTYFWRFGDDSTSTAPNPSHTFLVRDDHPYTVLLEVTDATALTGHASCDITVDPGSSSLPLRLNFVGDIMLARGYEAPGGIIPTLGVQAIFAPTLPFLGNAADITVANLECTLTRSGTPHPTKPIIFRGSPANVAGLSYAGIDVVTLANNHILDYGFAGLQETRSVVGGAGIGFSGAGADIIEASRPLFVLKSGLSIAFVAMSDRTGQYNNYQPYLDAGANKPGFAPLTRFELSRRIDDVRSSADLVIVEMHSGAEYSTVPGPEGVTGEDEGYSPAARVPLDTDRADRHYAIDAGADLVVCHHPHIIQGFETYRGRLIAHSLGNFAFDLSYSETFPSVILNAEADASGLVRYTVTPVYLDDDIPLRATGEAGVHLLDRLAMLSRELGTCLLVDKSAVTGTVVLDSTLLLPLTFVSDRIAPLRSSGGEWRSEPIRLPRQGSISTVSAVTPAGTWSYRLGREMLWMGNCEDEGVSLWSLDFSDESFDTTQHHRGLRSLRHHRSAGSGVLSTELENRLRPPADETEFSVGGWIRTANAAGVTVKATFYGSRTGTSELGTVTLGTPVPGTTEWSWYSGDAPAPTGTTFIDLKLQSSGPSSGTGTTWFDDVSVIAWGGWQTAGPGDPIPSPNDYTWLQVRTGLAVATATVTFVETGYADVHQPAQIEVPLAAGWNMVSNPVVRADSLRSVRSLFPSSSFEHAFRFSPLDGYMQATLLDPGVGYWAKFPAPLLQQITGEFLLQDTVTVPAGWTMIGSLSGPVDTSLITTLPPGLKVSPVYGYGGGYTPVTRLDPGRAYWMKVRDSGSVILTASAAGSPPPSAGAAPPTTWGALTFSDGAGTAQTLYYGRASDGFPDGYFEMPPPPPEGSFDARYADGMIAALASDGNATSFPILLSGAGGSVTVSWQNGTKGVAAILHAGARRVPLEGSGTLSLPPAGETLWLSLSAPPVRPVTYALHQNYPNPFNPSTTLQFTIVARQRTVVRVFDILGREVTTLIDEVMEPGTHSIRWNAVDVSGGVYFCRMQAGPFSATRKLLLLR